MSTNTETHTAAVLGSKRVHLSVELDGMGYSKPMCKGAYSHGVMPTDRPANCPKCLKMAVDK
jgi:hypothetical protein